MNIPTPEDFAIWKEGHAISSESLARLESFYKEMLEGAEALGEPFILATIYLRVEHHSISSLIWRRKHSGG